MNFLPVCFIHVGGNEDYTNGWYPLQHAINSLGHFLTYSLSDEYRYGNNGYGNNGYSGVNNYGYGYQSQSQPGYYGSRPTYQYGHQRPVYVYGTHRNQGYGPTYGYGRRYQGKLIYVVQGFLYAIFLNSRTLTVICYISLYARKWQR